MPRTRLSTLLSGPGGRLTFPAAGRHARGCPGQVREDAALTSKNDPLCLSPETPCRPGCPVSPAQVLEGEEEELASFWKHGAKWKGAEGGGRGRKAADATSPPDWEQTPRSAWLKSARDSAAGAKTDTLTRSGCPVQVLSSCAADGHPDDATHTRGFPRTVPSAPATGLKSARRGALFSAIPWPFQRRPAPSPVTHHQAVSGADADFPMSSPRGTAEGPCPLYGQRRRKMTSFFPTKLGGLRSPDKWLFNSSDSTGVSRETNYLRR